MVALVGHLGVRAHDVHTLNLNEHTLKFADIAVLIVGINFNCFNYT